MSESTRYPRTQEIKGGDVSLDLMTPEMEAEVLTFANTLDPHDLLFLRRDITQPKVLSAWSKQLETGEITSLIARSDGKMLGCTAVVRDERSWSPHVGELRVLVSPAGKERGLGRLLIQESFLIALSLKLQKLTAHMTVDQTSAINVFEEMGFKPEALLKDQVMDQAGEKHDIVILSHDVEGFQSQMQAYGLTDLY
ncbi:MAG: GNAT family N-acetyltransferase [Pseudomonadales bacterium]|jgi:RimJ/RimL family protein N-acetyltransferase|nr:GNAT family N-acetyltransferase [Pseudomonadales bacterium]